MTITRDPTKIHAIIDAGNKLRDKHLESLAEQLSRYHGPWFTGAGPVDEYQYDPANVAYQYVSLMLPVLAWDNPRFEVKSKKGAQADLVAQSLKFAMDRWAVDTDLQDALESLAVDFLFAYGVTLTEMVPSPDQDPSGKDPKDRPVVNRLDPRRYGMDPYADNYRDARIQWHTWARDKDDLLDEAKKFPERGWNVKAIETASADAGLEKLYRDPNAEKTPPRDEIVGYQVWIPEWELEEVQKLAPEKRKLFKGTLCDLAVSGPSGDPNTDGATFIREPRPFFGPAWGPYCVVGAYKVPGKLYPLGPLTACEGQNRELNEHKRAFLRSARTRKKIGLASNKDPLLQEIMTDTPEGEVAVADLDNLDRNFKEIELGGPTAEQRMTVMNLQMDADNALGMSDARRGEVTGTGTATENQIAAASSSQRVSWQKKKYRRGPSDAARTVAWYMWYGNVISPLSREGADAAGLPQGGDLYGDIAAQEAGIEPGINGLAAEISFDDLDLSIDIMSTERTDEGIAQARAIQIAGMFAEMVPVIMQAPMANWTGVFDMAGEAINRPKLGEFLGVDKLQQVGMGMMTTQLAMGLSGGAPGAPGQQSAAAPPQAPVQPNAKPVVRKGSPKPQAAAQQGQNRQAAKAGMA